MSCPNQPIHPWADSASEPHSPAGPLHTALLTVTRTLTRLQCASFTNMLVFNSFGMFVFFFRSPAFCVLSWLFRGKLTSDRPDWWFKEGQTQIKNPGSPTYEHNIQTERERKCQQKGTKHLQRDVKWPQTMLLCHFASLCVHSVSLCGCLLSLCDHFDWLSNKKC